LALLVLSVNLYENMIALRDLTVVSAQEIQQLANNYTIAKNLRDYFPSPYSLEDAISFLELVPTGVFGHVFALFQGDDFIGVGSLIPQQHEHRLNAEIGYWLGEQYWGKGYATDAVKKMVEFAFVELGLSRVYASVYDYNTASMRVLEKSGFEKDAVIKSSVIKEGNMHDEHLYSIRSV